MRFAKLLAVVLFLLITSECGFKSKQQAKIETCRSDIAFSRFHLKTPVEKIRIAKCWLQLPPDASEGSLWRRFMTRLYAVPENASIEQMEDGQVKRDLRDHLRYEGLPDWCPYQIINLKENFEENVVQSLLARYVYSISPFASREEFEKLSAIRYKEFESKAQASNTKLEFEDFYATYIIKAFCLPTNTPKEDAWALYTRAIHIFGGAYTKKASEEVRRRRLVEEAMLVLKLPADTPEELLLSDMRTVSEAVHLESPERPLKWLVFY